MIVPKINDWVAYRGFLDGPGKVVNIDCERQMFRADFLTEPSGDPSYDSFGSIEPSDWLPLAGIEYIISEPEKVAELEAEYSFGGS